MASGKIGELILKLHRDESLLKVIRGWLRIGSCEQGCTMFSRCFEVSRDFFSERRTALCFVRVPRSLTQYWPCSDEITSPCRPLRLGSSFTLMIATAPLSFPMVVFAIS